MSYQFFCGTRIAGGANALLQLTPEMTGLHDVLVISDSGVVGAGLLETVQQYLPQGIHCSVFSDVTPDPDVTSVEKAYHVWQQARPSTIIAVGGGSVIDVGKAVSILATNGGAIRNYEGRGLYQQSPLKLIAIPTTVGTGSEVTRGCVISDPDRRLKMVIAGPALEATLAIIDPLMVESLPTAVVRTTAMDALTHAIEGLVSRLASPITDALNKEAITLIAHNIKPAVTQGDVKAVVELQIAATITGMGFGNSLLGLVHSMSHPISAHYQVPHGIANAILLPYICEFNKRYAQDRYAYVASQLDKAHHDADIGACVFSLCRDIGIPETFSDLIPDACNWALDDMIERAMSDTYTQTNPRSTSRHDIELLYRQAIGGGASRG